jgi:hypothetical protein
MSILRAIQTQIKLSVFIVKMKRRLKMSEKEVQVSNSDVGLLFFDTIKEAMKYANAHNSAWKLNFSFGEERVRLVKHREAYDNFPYWVYEPIEFDNG